ncbi:hypothetical protein LIER_21998 [Lithospermum erythrorhizon]|uniref:Phytocyanin domain-containing protein n=1 Tax=Lithospermum erythrorhizon TaxID=34254 RepID=A0AAV3QS72_LITER
MARLGSFIVCMALVISVLATSIMGTTYTVGDANGWALGVDYGTWASGKTFKVGDSLVFNYGSSHSVSEVSPSDYSSCSSSNALSTDRSGGTTITLKTAGQHYFVCGVPGHCDGGQKLTVTVSGAETDTPSGGSTIAPPSGNTTPETPTTTTNAPTSTKNNDVPHSSSGSSLSPIAAIFFVACGVVVSGFIV